MFGATSEKEKDIIYDVPFLPQAWDFDQYESLGFSSYNEAEHWAANSCGGLCLLMAVNYLQKQKITIGEFIRRGLTLGAYAEPAGWQHAKMIHLAKQYGLQAEFGTYSATQIADHLHQGRLVIVSIKWAFENKKSWREQVLFWKRYGGHMALVVGMRGNRQNLEGFFVHHTSTSPANNWKNRFIPIKIFLGGYTGRAVVVYN